MMARTRREFLQTGAAVAATVVGGSVLAAQRATQPAASAQGSTGFAALPGAPVQVPKMKFFGAEISRLVLGHNPFYGFAHFNANLAGAMKEWYTQDRACEVMHRANAFGINAINFVNVSRAADDLARFRAEGGQMHLIAQVTGPDDVAALVRDLKPLAVHRQGEVVDAAYRDGKIGEVREWCKRVRDLGVPVGVGTHKPEVIDLVETEGWDVDFYAGCVYNRTRSEEEWRKVLGGELLEMPKEIYLQSDPARMFKAIRQTPKPCFAFKILAAGRIADGAIAQAFRTAFTSIKPIDGVYVGVFPRAKDEIRENAEIVHAILTAA